MFLFDCVFLLVELCWLGEVDLEILVDELCQYLLYIVGQIGGYFGVGFGVVELIIVLYYVFDILDDCLVWDVGYQVYLYKIFIECCELMGILCQKNGLVVFLCCVESEYDIFGVGYFSIFISVVLGMVIVVCL